MVKFLTEEWGDKVREALGSSEAVQNAVKGVNLTIQQVVTDVPDQGEVKYWTKFNDGAIDGGIGEAADADVTIAQSYETASAMNRGELNAQAAFMQGKLKVTGNMGKLLQHQGAIQALGPVMQSVETEY